MKKLNIKKKYIFLALVSFLIGYFGLRYYIKPDWFDLEYTYHKVYQYKVSKIKPQKKIIKDINIEIIHDIKEQKPTDGKWKETIRTDIDSYRIDPILHVTFTDNSKADIPLRTDRIGPAFSWKNLDDELYKKLSSRFPLVEPIDVVQYHSLESVLMLYQGDTLFQIPEEQTVIQFQVKNPNNGKLQTYYQYGSEPKFNYFRPVFFLQNKAHLFNEKPEFFNAYNQSSQKNYWDRDFDFRHANLSISQEYRYYRLFYSDRLSNQPVGISPTGHTFKTTITDTYILPNEDQSSEGEKVTSKSKTYTDQTEYTYEILDRKKPKIIVE